MEQSELDEQERSDSLPARLNPFDDPEIITSRKRRKTSNGSARSVSADTAVDLDITTDSSDSSRRADFDLPLSPHTPPTVSSDQAVEPTSSKVTINLRSTTATLDSSNFNSPQSPSVAIVDTKREKTTVKIDSDEGTAIQPVQTPTSSNSRSSSPRVDVLNFMEVGSDLEIGPTIRIIDDERGEEDYEDVIEDFPSHKDSETASQTVLRVARHLQYGICKYDPYSSVC